MRRLVRTILACIFGWAFFASSGCTVQDTRRQDCIDKGGQVVEAYNGAHGGCILP